MKPTNTKEISALQTKVDKLKEKIQRRVDYINDLEDVIKTNQSVIEGERAIVTIHEDHIKLLRGLDGAFPVSDQPVIRAND